VAREARGLTPKQTDTRPCPRCDGTGRIPDDRALGQHMRVRRERTGLSLRDMAKRCGWSAAYVSDLELGRRSWGPKQTKRYTEALR